MRIFFMLLLIPSICNLFAYGNEPVSSGTVVSVLDGNTLEVKMADNQTLKVFLFGIDCPELTQDYGALAKKCLEKLLLGHEVKVEFRGKDRRGNQFAIVTTALDDDPRVELLREGLAWTLESGTQDLNDYISFAQQKKKGLWKAKNPTPPWEYRRQQSMMAPKKS